MKKVLVGFFLCIEEAMMEERKKVARKVCSL